MLASGWVRGDATSRTIKWWYPVPLIILFVIASNGSLYLVHFGMSSTSLQGLLTIAILLVALVYLALGFRSVGHYPRIALAVAAAFFGWQCVVALWTGINAAGAQYLLVIALGMIFLILGTVYVPRGREMSKFVAALRCAAVLALVAVLMRTFLSGDWVESSDRVVLMFLALLMPILLATSVGWTSIYSWLLPIAITFTIVVMNARTATVMVLLCWVAFTALRGKRIAKWAAVRRRMAAVLGAVISISAIVAFGFLWRFGLLTTYADRMFGKDASLQIGPLSINGEGRAGVWTELLQEAGVTGWFGGGIGHAQDFVGALPVLWPHPHNEYLRLYVDSGVVGLSLFLLMLFLAGYACFRQIRKNRSSLDPAWAAVFMIFGLLLFMALDNPLAYLVALPPTTYLIAVSYTLSESGEGWNGRELVSKQSSPSVNTVVSSPAP